jgi:hypothetical protein
MFPSLNPIYLRKERAVEVFKLIHKLNTYENPDFYNMSKAEKMMVAKGYKKASASSNWI